jgi:hypothetical protein
MKPNDFEDELKNLKLIHLTENELVSYCERGLDKITQARVDAHLKQCFICDRRLGLFREATAPSGEQEITAEDIAMVRRVMRLERSGQQSITSTPADATPRLPFSERLTEYLQQLCVSWHLQFSQPAVHSAAEPGKEVWDWRSPDRELEGRAILERTGDLTIRFSSREPEMEGIRLKVILGPFTNEITMRRVSESKIRAEVKVPRRNRPKKLGDISIEVI